MFERLPTIIALCALSCGSASGAVAGASLDDITAAVAGGAYQQITSIIVARDDQVLYEHYFDADGADALHNTRSATKTITGMLVGAAVDRGLLRAGDAFLYGNPSSVDQELGLCRLEEQRRRVAPRRRQRPDNAEVATPTSLSCLIEGGV